MGRNLCSLPWPLASFWICSWLFSRKISKCERASLTCPDESHQWMFVTDTTDAVYPSEDFTPEAIMDTLAEILREQSLNAKVSYDRA